MRTVVSPYCSTTEERTASGAGLVPRQPRRELGHLGELLFALVGASGHGLERAYAAGEQVCEGV
jgi:hypothetical protein